MKKNIFKIKQKGKTIVLSYNKDFRDKKRLLIGPLYDDVDSKATKLAKTGSLLTITLDKLEKKRWEKLFEDGHPEVARFEEVPK